MNELMKKRTCSKDIVNLGDEVNQTITLTNRSEYEITNIQIKDTFSEGVNFKANSIVIDGASYTGYNPINGFTLPSSIKVGSSATITYRIIIDSTTTKESFAIVSAVTYTFDTTTVTENSDTYTMELPNGDITVEMTVDKLVATKNDEIQYTIKVSNIGNLRNTAVTITDPMPDGTSFVEKSVIVNNTSQPTYNPATGFSVGNIDPNSSATASFKVKLI